MKNETRLRNALARTVGGMVECANEVVIQATDYQSQPVDERYAPVVRLLRKLIKDGAKVLAQTKVVATLVDPPLPGDEGGKR